MRESSANDAVANDAAARLRGRVVAGIDLPGAVVLVAIEVQARR